MRRRAFLGWAVTSAWPGIALAHHGFGGRYDISQAIWLAGQVESARIGMPHPVLRLRVAAAPQRPTALKLAAEFEPRLVLRPQDAGQLREIEFPPVARFLELGPEIKPGDALAVIAWRNCSPPHQLRGQWVQLASGRVVVREGRMQTEVQGCEAR